MADAQSLTLAFLANHHIEAARVTETLPSAEAAALFAEIPARIGAPVLAAMLPASAGRVISVMPEEKCVEVLNVCGTQAAVAMLRFVAEARRTHVIAKLATFSAVASRVLLGFPEDAVGAWADPEIIALPGNTQVGAAIERFQHGQEPSDDTLFVIDAKRRLSGSIALRALLRAPHGASLATLVRAPPAMLSAMMPIGSAAHSPAWSHANCLPVVDRDQRLIGVLHRATLAQALHNRTPRPHTSAEASATSFLAASYWGIVAGLISAALALLPATKRVLPEEK